MLQSNGHMKKPIRMLVLPAIGAIAFAGYVAGSENEETPVQAASQIKDRQFGSRSNQNLEQREAMHTGFLRSANRGSNIIDSEETRAIRPARGSSDPRFTAGEWQQYHYEKNNKLGYMASWARALDNLKILRYDYSHKPGLLMLPNLEGFSEFQNVPNAKFDRRSAQAPWDERIDLYRDPFGTSGGAPIQGRSNVVLNKLYVGNPWGAGGQQFIAVGNQHRDPGYADHKPTGILKNNDADATMPSIQKLQQHVRFNEPQ